MGFEGIGFGGFRIFRIGLEASAHPQHLLTALLMESSVSAEEQPAGTAPGQYDTLPPSPPRSVAPSHETGEGIASPEAAAANPAGMTSPELVTSPEPKEGEGEGKGGEGEGKGEGEDNGGFGSKVFNPPPSEEKSTAGDRTMTRSGSFAGGFGGMRKLRKDEEREGVSADDVLSAGECRRLL